MTRAQFLAEVAKRIDDNEGDHTYRYLDSKGIPTIGIGFNLLRADADSALRSVGSSLAAVNAGASLTEAQVQQLFAYSFSPIEAQARASLGPNIYDTLSDARRFVICDLVFNLGQDGWLEFAATRQLISTAQTGKNQGNLAAAHQCFELAAEHLEATPWYGQVGDRAKRDVAMLRSGLWVSPTGDGTDTPYDIPTAAVASLQPVQPAQQAAQPAPTLPPVPSLLDEIEKGLHL
jgi:GH24 family phage-related lysozyme (muramidase)